MKNYTAIYDTETLQNVHYYFNAENMEAAKEFCKGYFNVPVKQIMEHTDTDFLAIDLGQTVTKMFSYEYDKLRSYQTILMLEDDFNENKKHVLKTVNSYKGFEVLDVNTLCTMNSTLRRVIEIRKTKENADFV